MPAYSEFDGVPVHASRFLLRKVLREELGFKGTTVSDYDGITMFTYLHNIASDSLRCAEIALKAGIKDVVFDRGGFLYHGRIQALADAAREAGLNFYFFY